MSGADETVRLRAAYMLFCLGAIYFAALGPWRAVRSSNAYDFASVYGAGRAWLHGRNPYDMRVVTAEVHLAGNDPLKYPDASAIQPSVYLPATLPVAALFGCLRWEAAKVAWVGLSAAVFACSVAVLLGGLDIPASGRWFLAAGAFVFTPASLGLSHGNPSVPACGLTTLAICFAMSGRGGLGALTLGLAHCLKPQLSIAGLALFALWGYWRPFFLSFAFPAAATAVSVLRAPSLRVYGQWLASLREALASAALPGSINDPTPANHWAYSMVNAQTLAAVWVRDAAWVNAIVWLIAGALIICYLATCYPNRRSLNMRRDVAGDRRFRDMAFFSAVTLIAVYHRFYDEQLLLLAIPFLATEGNRSRAVGLVLWIGMLALLFPLHAVSEWASGRVVLGTVAGVLLLRPQPIIILGMCLLLIPWEGLPGSPGDKRRVPLL